MAFRIDVTYDTSAEVVARIPALLREIVTTQKPIRFDRSHFATYTDSALRFETVYYVLDPDYTRYMDIQQAINLEILRRFGAENIRFAFPTRTVDWSSGAPKLETEMPARVSARHSRQ